MGAVNLFFITALALGVSADNMQWSPYNMPVADQQVQASIHSGSYDVGGDHGSFGGQDYSSHGDFGGHSLSSGGDFGGHSLGGGGDFGGHGGFDPSQFKAQSYNVHQHIEEDNPEPIKHYKEVVVPLPKNVEFKINQPIIIPVPHPVPIHVPVPKAVVIPIVKEVHIPVEKSVPYPVEKTVHVPTFKKVPFEVVKHVLVPVEKPFPFKVPVYETIIHTKKGSHKF